MANKNIMIAMPVGTDTIKAKTAFSLVQGLKALKVEYDLLMRMSCDISASRTGLVKEAIRRGFTHILFVDHDMFFAPNTIQKLLDSDKDIIGAAYNKRKLPLESTAIPQIEPAPTTIPFKVNALGAGLLLINLAVFEKIDQPWFIFGYDKEGEMLFGEDTFFVQKTIKAGFDVWVDPTLQVMHIGEFAY